ncbi:MAG: cellulase family glycosylhydrolase, partial [Planctomycetota bacterium]
MTLTGVNIGNWLLLEPWMLAIPTEGSDSFRDQHDILTLLNERFGPERAGAFLDTYRAHWFTARDAAIIRGFGMNLVRVPFHYSLLTSDEGPLELRDDAFQWLDRAVELATDAGLYVILDLHGAPGGQSIDMPSGRVGQNLLWTSPEHQRRTAWLWGKISERYKDHDAVIAYDLLNEPYGDFQTDLSQELIELMDAVIREVRSVDESTLVFLPGQLSGIDFYGDPKDRSWDNAGFTEHFYPGIFGNEERSLRRHARFVACELAVRRHQLQKSDVPFLVGEINTIFEWIGGPTLLAEHIKRFENEGWMTTMWSYRIHRNDGRLPRDNWTLVANAEAFAFDVHTMSYEELIETAERLSVTPLDKDEPFRNELRDRDMDRPGLFPLLPAASIGDVGSSVPGWTIRGIGGGTPGGSSLSGSTLTLSGGGDDVFGRSDSFVLASHEQSSSASSRTIAADIIAFDAHHQYAKAGLMVRESDASDAAHASVHVIPSGEIRMLWRREASGSSAERTLAVAALPVRVGIVDAGDRLEAWAADANGELA